MNKLKQNILAGVFAILPVSLTVVIINWLFQFFAKPGAKLIESFLDIEKIPRFLPELIGFAATIIIIYVLGLFVRNYLGRRILQWVEGLFTIIPIVNSIYRVIKQITTTLTAPRTQAFQKVVFIEYPRRELWTIAMVTGQSQDADGRNYYHLFVPTTPNPTSGYMIIIPQEDAIETEMSTEDGLKMVISGGLVAPEKNDIRSITQNAQT